MKSLLFLSLLFFSTHNLFGINESLNNNLIEHFNEIFELEELAIEDFVEQLKEAKKLEYKKKSGFSLLHVATEQYVNIETYSGQYNAQINDYAYLLFK